MTSIRPVPKRRHDPDMQNYVYKGETARVAREKAQKRSRGTAQDSPRTAEGERPHAT